MGRPRQQLQLAWKQRLLSVPAHPSRADLQRADSWSGGPGHSCVRRCSYGGVGWGISTIVKGHATEPVTKTPTQPIKAWVGHPQGGRLGHPSRDDFWDILSVQVKGEILLSSFGDPLRLHLDVPLGYGGYSGSGILSGGLPNGVASRKICPPGPFPGACQPTWGISGLGGV